MPPQDPDRIFERLFSKPKADSVKRAQALLHESARHNLGETYRNYNLPLVAPLFLLPQNQARFHFRLHGESLVGHTSVVELDYEETTLPTIFRDMGLQRDLKARGRFWIEAATGHTLRTEMRMHPLQADGTLRVEFSLVEKLGLLAPREMHDRFEEQSTVLEGTAEYRNYRRFETEVGAITYQR